MLFLELFYQMMIHFRTTFKEKIRLHQERHQSDQVQLGKMPQLLRFHHFDKMCVGQHLPYLRDLMR